MLPLDKAQDYIESLINRHNSQLHYYQTKINEKKEPLQLHLKMEALIEIKVSQLTALFYGNPRSTHDLLKTLENSTLDESEKISIRNHIVSGK